MEKMDDEKNRPEEMKDSKRKNSEEMSEKERKRRARTRQEMIWEIREKMQINQHRLLKALILYVLALGLMIIICSVLNGTGLWSDSAAQHYFDEKCGFTYQDILFTQISVSFIVISLTSVLSADSKVIYWVDIIQMELVDPILTDFLAYSMYVFACLTSSVYFVICKSDYVYISFAASIIIMALLTIKLIGVNFESEAMRKKVDAYYDWIAQKGENDPIYKGMINTFVNITIKYVQEKDVTAFFENFDFLYKKFKEKKKDQKGKGEVDSLCLIIELLGRENDFFLRRILEKIDSDDGYIVLKGEAKFKSALNSMEGTKKYVDNKIPILKK